MAKQFPKIDANPTKRFFISMLVRDIDLLEAIVDLVDNSVDAARSLRPLPKEPSASGTRYSGLVVELNLNAERFSIKDNCGGISAAHAQKYVFNFGRQEDFPAIEGSVGQFGVGMKRALFKIGNHFTVTSRDASSSFSVDVPVDEWARSKENPWEFEFAEYEPVLPKAIPAKDRFTHITVDQLHPAVAQQFVLGRFINELSNRLGQQHQASLDQGLEILVNNATVARRRPLLLASAVVQPAHIQLTVDEREGEAPVMGELFVGLSDTGEQDAAGWYIYCNDRLVVAADKTALTGWGRAAGGTLPAYHPQYRRFRGFAFLACDDAGRLPWNTTKTNVDATSVIFQRLLAAMLPLMQQVVAVIDEADREMDSYPRGAGPLNKAIKNAVPAALSAIPTRSTFNMDVKRAPKGRDSVSVQYRVDRDQLEEVKDSLGMGSASAAGLATFEYYYESEVL